MLPNTFKLASFMLDLMPLRISQIVCDSPYREQHQELPQQMLADHRIFDQLECHCITLLRVDLVIDSFFLP